jgi:antitoxin MazE
VKSLIFIEATFNNSNIGGQLTYIQKMYILSIYINKEIIMQAYIQKWGNSLGLRIPMQLANQLKLHPGSLVILAIEQGRIIIQSPKYDLEMMLNDITEINQHHLILDDDQKGNEEW